MIIVEKMKRIFAPSQKIRNSLEYDTYSDNVVDTILSFAMTFEQYKIVFKYMKIVRLLYDHCEIGSYHSPTCLILRSAPLFSDLLQSNGPAELGLVSLLASPGPILQKTQIL